MRSNFAVLALVATIALAKEKGEPCRKKPDVMPKLNVRKALTPVNAPASWEWNNVNGANMVTTVRQQHIPQYCGSCWAQAAASSVSDRIKIARGGAWPEINIAPQVLISCEMKDDGCFGGYALNAYEFMAENEITDETCSTYRARGHTNGEVCSAMNVCRNCNPGEACFVPDKYYVYGVDEYGTVSGEENMI